MDGQNPKNKNPRNHGLRLVKGSRSESNADSRTNTDLAQTHTLNKAKANPLVMQLKALSDAIESDVKMILEL